MKEYNAQIESTMLGLEDHGIMTFMLYLKYDSCGQGFGNYALNGPTQKGEGKSIDAIRKILETVGVDRWEDLKGKYIRIRKTDGYGGRIESIGHIIEDKWWSPQEHWGK